jgi:NADPH:quinone reductase-like Zn-dependent oxidoreductase
VKAYFLESRGKETRLELREVEQPKPKDNQVLVRVRAAGLNRGEFIAGHGLTPPGAAKPAGQEAAGELVGSGERVMGRAPGAFAEYALMDRREAIPIPPGLDFEQAAAIPLTFMVVHDMLVEQGGLKSGEWLLVTGVTSGVGVAALQAAKALGAKVIGTSGSDEKLSKLQSLGLDVALRTRGADPSVSKKILEATAGQGVNLIVNTVGAAQRRAARGHGARLCRSLPAVLCERAHRAAGRPGFPLRRAAGRQGLHGIRRARRQDRPQGIKKEGFKL